MDTIYKIQKTIEYIEDHLSNEITLDDLASQIFCSKFHYHRIFQSMVGEPTNEYIRKRRLSTAAKLLKSSDCKITDVAPECGYSSQVSFTKACKWMDYPSPQCGKIPILSACRTKKAAQCAALP